MSTILALDTVSDTFALALARDGRIVRSLSREAGQDHSRLLLAAVDEILDRDQTGLDGLVVVLGPGSYAGLRVGVATAQGLALALSVPIRGISTLEAVAAAAGLADGTAIHPAGRGEFAAQDFSDGRPSGPIRPTKADDLKGRLLVGEGAALFGGREVTPEERCRSAVAILEPSFDRDLKAGEVEPIYLREPSISLPRRPRPALGKA